MVALHNAPARLPNSGGQPLDPETREFMQPRFGHDLGDVRIHTDAEAAEAAGVLDARAFTAGRNIVFGRGQYHPATGPGRHLLAHELAHVLQQSGAAHGPPGIQRVKLKVDTVDIEFDYTNVHSVKAADRPGAIMRMYRSWTGDDPSTVDALVLSLTGAQQKWVLWGLDLLIDNTKAGDSSADRVNAALRLIGHAPHATTGLAGKPGPFEREVLRESGWLATLLTRPLSAPTGADLTALQSEYELPKKKGGKLDVARMRQRVTRALLHFMNTKDPARWAKTGKHELSTIQDLGDIIVQEAREFFTPFVDAASGSVLHGTPAWKASEAIFSSTEAVRQTPPTPAFRRQYLLNRANVIGFNTKIAPQFIDANIFSQVNYDAKRDSDKRALEDLVFILEKITPIQEQVDRIATVLPLKKGVGRTAKIGISTEFDESKAGPCEARWKMIDDLCHELLHALVHADFLRVAPKKEHRQVIDEGFTEVLGTQLYNEHIADKANKNPDFKEKLEAGLPKTPCATPAAATVGYRAAGAAAERIRGRVKDKNFRAAYFLGKIHLVGL